MPTATSTLIPPGRLGALLSSRRQAMGLDIAQMSHRSGGRFSPNLLVDLERGRTALDDVGVAELTQLYEVESGPVVPSRSKLVVDLTGGQLRVGDTGVDVAGNEIDEVLERYLSLLYLLRNMQPGKQLTLRTPDLEILSESLERTLAELEQRLGHLMLGTSVETRTTLLRKRLIVPGAGLLVGLTTIGALVMIGGGAATPATDVVMPDSASAPSAQLSTVQSISIGERIVLPSGVTAEIVDTSGAETPALETPAVEMSAVESEAPTHSAFADAVAEPVEATPVAEAAPAVEAAPVEIATPSTFAERGAEAEALISYDFRAVLDGWTISYEDDTPGYRGLTNLPSKTISIYINDGDTAGDIAEILAHEVGHAIDVSHLDDADRYAWLDARGMPGVWWAGSGMSDFEVGAGDWAEGVAAYLTGSASSSAYGDFSADQLALVAELLP